MVAESPKGMPYWLKNEGEKKSEKKKIQRKRGSRSAQGRKEKRRGGKKNLSLLP